MKEQFFITLLFILAVISCNKNSKNLDQVKDNKMETYFLNHDIRNIDYEIFLNDILISQSINNNGLPAPINLNSYIFKNGQQKVRIKLSTNSEENLTQEIINGVNKSLSVHLLTNDNYGNMKEILKLNFPLINSPIKYYEHEWLFEANAIEGIGNLSQSIDLVRIEKDELQKEVVSKYQELRKLLNEGNGKAFMKEIEKAKASFFLAENILKDKQGEYNSNMEEYFDSHKGTIPTIGNFTLRVMGNSRAVSLENNSNHKGLGILSSEDIQNNTLNVNYIILHKPVGADKFEVFRYNCTYTALK
ncbi:MAG TPA: hypothetical protein VF677_10845 [Flavobacterium sp.]